MKCLRKLLAVGLAVMSLATSAVVPAMAESRTENFTVYLNGGSIVSGGSARKEVSGKMYAYVSERPGTYVDWVQGAEVVNLRGRSANGQVKVTSLRQTAYSGGYYMTYYSGYGNLNSYYKLAVQYDDENPYEYLELQCSWRP